MTTSMRVTLLLTGALLLLSVSAGFAIQNRETPERIAVQNLQQADKQLARKQSDSARQARTFIREAMQTLNLKP